MGGAGCDGIEPKIFFYSGKRVVGIEIAHERDDGIVRSVIDAKEILHVLDGRGVQVGHGSDHRVFVSEIIVGQAVYIEFGAAVGLIVNSLAALFLHGVALVIEIRLIDIQRAHAIGLEKKSQIELIFRQLLEVSGAVFGGGAVHVAAVVEDQHEMLALADILRALKHHVLEEMRVAGMAGAFVAAAHVVRNVNRVNGRAVIGDENYAEAVIEFCVAQIELRDTYFGARGSAGGR